MADADKIQSIKDACDNCGLPNSANRISPYAIIITAISIVPTISAFIYPFIFSGATIKEYQVSNLILFILCTVLTILVISWDLLRNKSKKHIRSTCDFILEGSSNKSIYRYAIQQKLAACGLVEILLKDEWLSSRKERILGAKKSIFAYGYNLSNTFESQGTSLFKRLRENIETSGVKITAVISSEGHTDNPQHNNKIAITKESLHQFRSALSDNSKQLVKLIQTDKNNMDYILIIDDEDIYIRWNLLYSSFEICKTAVLHFKASTATQEFKEEFIEPIISFRKELDK